MTPKKLSNQKLQNYKHAKEYVIKKGDTLTAITNMFLEANCWKNKPNAFQVFMCEIVSLNKIKNINLIKEGQRLKIPTSFPNLNLPFISTEFYMEKKGRDTIEIINIKNHNERVTAERNTQTFLPLSELGLHVLEASLKLTIRDAQKFKEAFKQGRFTGDGVNWKSGFQGNQHVNSWTVQAIKNDFYKKIKYINKITNAAKFVKGVGGALSLVSLGCSIRDAVNEKISYGELILDTAMTGVAFIPVYGWVVSSAYFIGKAIFSRNDIEVPTNNSQKGHILHKQDATRTAYPNKQYYQANFQTDESGKIQKKEDLIRLMESQSRHYLQSR